MPFKILISDKLDNEAVEIFKKAKDLEVDIKVGLPPEELAAIIGDYDGLIVRSATKVTADIISKASRLKIIGRAGVGVDNVDLNAATERGIIVMNTPGGNTVSTAEHTWSLMMSLARNIPQATQSMREGKWEKTKFKGVELFGKTLGVIGVGRVGSIVGSRALAFGMKVLACDPYTAEEQIRRMGFESSDLEHVFRNADFITFHCILTNETRHIVDDDALAKMKKGVRIINCARGGIIDEEALFRALESGHVAGAALDVFEKEPVDPDNPLLKHPNCIMTPHLGASTTEAQVNVAIAIAHQVVDALTGGEIKNAVNIPALDPKIKNVIAPYLLVAEKLGMCGIQLLSRTPEHVEIIYAGEVSELDTSLLTVNVLKGILSPITEETVNEVNAPFLAKRRGIRFSETKTEDNEGYSSLITVRLQAKEEEYSLSGTIFPPKDPRIVRLNGYHIDARPDGYLVILRNTDEPGIVGHVGTVLGKAGINIADMKLARKEPGGPAFTVLNVDQHPNRELVEQLGAIPQILDVKMVNLK